MKKTTVWVLVLLVLAAGAFWFMNRSDSGAETPAEEVPAEEEPAEEVPAEEEPVEEAPAEEEERQQPVVVKLSEQNDSGMSGTATLTQMNEEEILVELDLGGAPEDLAQPAHIHSGSCAELGGVVYPLEFPVNGVSGTVLNVSFSELADQLPLAVNVHKSPEEAGTYVACGDLTL